MTSVLLDTHSWVWSFAADDRLSGPARATIASADSVCVSPISFFEIGQTVRTCKWPKMKPHVDELPGILPEQGGIIAPLTAEVSLAAATWDWSHRDPFDRLIACTARLSGLVLISRDSAFAEVAGLRVIW